MAQHLRATQRHSVLWQRVTLYIPLERAAGAPKARLRRFGLRRWASYKPKDKPWKPGYPGARNRGTPGVPRSRRQGYPCLGHLTEILLRKLKGWDRERRRLGAVVCDRRAAYLSTRIAAQTAFHTGMAVTVGCMRRFSRAPRRLSSESCAAGRHGHFLPDGHR